MASIGNIQMGISLFFHLKEWYTKKKRGETP